jgi:arylsulfatase A-like enzyme
MSPRIPLLALAFAALLSLPARAADSRPNVLVILADDQGWGDLSANGNRLTRTPNIDTIAQDGASFQRFYVCPVCSPTRAEFLTGRYHTRGGVTDVTHGGERLNPDAKTIADVFRAAGYATGAFGKWHNGSQWPYHPNARGFTEYYGFTSGHWGEYFNPPLEHNGEPVRAHGYIADDLTTHALQFIEQQHAKGTPFFCYLPFNTPHSPYSVPDDYWRRHETHDIAQRGDLGDAEDLPSTRAVAAMNENLDDNVGRVLRRLDELKLSRDTIVVYFSDNGPQTRRWNAGMKGIKGSTDEGGVRAPCFIRWPGKIPAGKSVPQIAAALDLLPTLASLAAIPLAPEKPLDGRDVSPLLTGTEAAASWPERSLVQAFRGRASLRTQQYRLDAAGALYDMVADPEQKRDVAAAQPEIKAQLAQSLAAWKTSTGFVAGGGGARDDRPFTVGYREFPITPLPARDGEAKGGVERSGKAPNCSFFTNWKTPADAMTWDIDVHTAGEYEVELWYTTAAQDAGATVEVSFQNASVSGPLAPAWDPPLITGEDRAPRKGESFLKEFKPLTLGRLKLAAGRGLLTIRATKIVGQSVGDLRLVRLKLLP